jgi:hypothetical protein
LKHMKCSKGQIKIDWLSLKDGGDRIINLKYQLY